MRWRVANQTRSKLRLLCGFAVFSLSPSLFLLQCSHSVRHSTRRAGRTKHVYTSDRTGTRTNNGQHKESSCRSVQCLWQTQASWARRKKERNGKEVGGGGGVGGISAQQSTDTTLDQSTGGPRWSRVRTAYRWESRLSPTAKRGRSDMSHLPTPPFSFTVARHLHAAAISGMRKLATELFSTSSFQGCSLPSEAGKLGGSLFL